MGEIDSRQPNRRILVVGHSCDTSGAPRVLLSLVRWMVRECGWLCDMAFGTVGGLRDEFETLGPVVDATAHDRRRTFAQRVASVLRIAYRFHAFPRIPFEESLPRPLEDYDAIYVNTVLALHTLRRLRTEIKVPVFLHVHELGKSIGVLSGGGFSAKTAGVTRFIAASEAVQRCLVAEYGIHHERIAMVREFIEDKNFVQEPSPAEGRQPAAEVLGVGFAGWRKGTDLFVQIASLTQKLSGRPVRFAWLGPVRDDTRSDLEYDIERLGLRELVDLRGEIADVRAELARSKVALCTSREDPYPLAYLEAAAQRKPIVCFADAGGMPELVERGAGSCVPYLDVEAAAEAVVEFLANYDKAKACGDKGHLLVHSECRAAVGAAVIVDLIDSVLQGSASL
jgi:glycosyltransferase involved in cell wall biosynthesis